MIKVENIITPSPEQWRALILGTRNPKNSWHLSDSETKYESWHDMSGGTMDIGPNDHKLMMSLAKGGPVHAKYRRMIVVYMDITAPLYWWKEFDTYRVGVEKNSCSTMHKIHAKEFTLDDFSCEHLIDSVTKERFGFDHKVPDGVTVWADDDTGCLAVTCSGNYHKDHSYKDTLLISQKDILDMFIIPALNANREAFLKTNDKKYWWQMIQLLPSSYNQKRTIMLNYEVLHNMYHSRKNHKLDCWREFCKLIETLPYSEIITQLPTERD